MVANIGAGTRPEVEIQNALRKLGFTFSTNVKPIQSFRCNADIVFRSLRLCIFIDGCFWHGCPKHFRLPKSNTAWWREKMVMNRAKDRRQRVYLTANGWAVLSFWEHVPRTEIVAEIVRFVAKKPLARRKLESGFHSK
jgi:DNA mismatch endonuclease, patch repair protein